MYASNRSQDAAYLGSRGTDDSRGRESFRPVALPALAAAVHIHSLAAQAARTKLAARQSAQIVHEDEPFI
ncbi:hypothetical protein [Methylobacterium haplocladii]|uniref:Uncharacterized protein n=1 Tax=Methylobacterium haplocladii TaxID=1176176 RepID=A0A512IK90_9HYPH|nr:hypothetical protein [Methylobacterium haplocladii]GEO98058.1 hypothetical protein MHA02_04460 [Methylobacterium haplocladii]GJD85678.1 hypothetical protein HPGCJGGD_3569 [Methylobacterium haplocladii]GLS60103.1 hypothetical protein GCM10007887_27800 [Methylobacterium haplocladii]